LFLIDGDFRKVKWNKLSIIQFSFIPVFACWLSLLQVCPTHSLPICFKWTAVTCVCVCVCVCVCASVCVSPLKLLNQQTNFYESDTNVSSPKAKKVGAILNFPQTTTQHERHANFWSCSDTSAILYGPKTKTGNWSRENIYVFVRSFF
jgi:hypothetical protein